MVHNHIHKSPCLSHHLPMVNRGQRCNNQKWTTNFANFNQVIENRHRLDRLSKTHLIGQDNISIVLESSEHPIKSEDLVILHLLIVSELRHQIILVVVLKIPLLLIHALKLQQL